MALVAAVFGGNAFAAPPTCVTSADQLQAALTAAQSNGQDDDIRVVRGIFTAPSGGFLANIAGSDAAKALSVSGAWLDGCGEQAHDPAGTELNGGGAGRVLKIGFATPGATGAVSISSLTIADGADATGAFQFSNSYFDGSLTIDRVAFVANVGDVAAAFYLATGGTLLFTNNLSIGNSSALYRAVGAISLTNSGKAALINNTFADNVASYYRSIGIGSSDSNTILVQNNIFANGANGMPTQSIVCAGSQANFTTLVANYIDSHNCGAAIEQNPLQASSIFRAGDYQLAPGSELIDAGVTTVAPQGTWTPGLPLRDFYGRPRVLGASVDAGAIEFDETLFVDGFELP